MELFHLISVIVNKSFTSLDIIPLGLNFVILFLVYVQQDVPYALFLVTICCWSITSFLVSSVSWANHVGPTAFFLSVIVVWAKELLLQIYKILESQNEFCTSINSSFFSTNKMLVMHTSPYKKHYCLNGIQVNTSCLETCLQFIWILTQIFHYSCQQAIVPRAMIRGFVPKGYQSIVYNQLRIMHVHRSQIL